MMGNVTMMSGMTQFWLWIAFLGMAGGALVFGLRAIAMRRSEGMEFPLESLYIALWAATMYLTMALGETVFPVNGKIVYLGRYLDWIVTTPLLLLELGVIAGLRSKLIVGIIGADVFMIITGLIGNLVKAPTNYLWWIISTGAFLAILFSLFTEFSESASLRTPRVNSLFTSLRNILVVLWICYPIIWLFGSEGFGIISVGLETAIYAIVDLCAKIGFGIKVSFASKEVLAQASNSKSLKEVAQSYVGRM